MRCIGGCRQVRALLAAIAVWGVVFAGAFTAGVYLVQDDLMAYLYLLFLPQVLSSVTGAAVYVAVLRKQPGVSRRGARFAAATCLISAFAGVLALFLLDHEMPGGWEFLGFFGLVFGITLAVDTPFAALGGMLADGVAQRSAAPGEEEARD
jgi:hypothetical protein